VHNAVPHRNGCAVDILRHDRQQNREGMVLRFVNTLALHQRGSIGGTNMQAAIAVANAVGASGQQRFFVPASAAIDAELQRR